MTHMAEAGRWNKNGVKGFLGLIILLNLWLDYQVLNTSEAENPHIDLH